MTHLAEANEVRLARAEDKRRIRRGEVDTIAILLAPPHHWESAHLSEFLMCLPKLGRVKVDAVLRKLRLNPTRTVGLLSDAERARVVHEVAKYLHGPQTDRMTAQMELSR